MADHSWTREDDVLACYLQMHGEDDCVTMERVAKYLDSHSDSGKDLDEHCSAIKMRMANCQAVLTNYKKGLKKPSKRTVEVCNEYRDKSQSEHKARCKEILAGMKQSKKIAPYTTTLHEGNAYWMARLAKEVCLSKSKSDRSPDEDKILSNLQADDSGFVSVTGTDKNSAQGALIEHKKFLCLAFRGTDELADWLDNMNVFATQEMFGEFHSGFWNSVADVWRPLNNKLKHLRREKKQQKQQQLPLFITGHSLGGAMATIAAARLIHEDRPFTSVYTFGQPRALARQTARLFNAECRSRFFRFHNNNDIVTRLPARIMGYSHIGTYLYISKKKSIHEEAGFWFRFVDCVDGAFSSVKEKGLDAIKDHNMAGYLRAVEKWDLRTSR